ncbi:GTP-binding protein [Butyrivibrio sp. X503]|uniref:translation factor GTPase family protein n=1 Tax=Butyrivibrio sp. X503 TaxID=2364878 RepID=UPI000EA95BB1|nr:TetM/TetW/TetO/TetS family tetracycline resistance ribosomal protection protein [Butyrivibrio sp. X503]RKM58101.1 GTP-binding protein [Butyrivibrio sp. X503]
MHNLTMGILAHVDAGKTTLSEAILFLSGAIRKAGRVDHKDTFLDTYELERARGITIFSKQAVFEYNDTRFDLLDTPGHTDFSPEMERTLQVLDVAVLMISGPDGVTGQVKLLYKLLKHYNIPTVIFVNKMDQPLADKERCLNDIRASLSSSCIDLSEGYTVPEIQEELAMCDEELLSDYLNGKKIEKEDIYLLIKNRKCFPVLFGSALKAEGVKELMELVSDLAPTICNGESRDSSSGVTGKGSPTSGTAAFGARVFKISRDPSGNRLTHIKITSGSLNVRDVIGDEKVDQIRIYAGDKYEAVQSATAGMICSVTGLKNTSPGAGLGVLEGDSVCEVLQPILSCALILPEDIRPITVYNDLKNLEEEEPMLRVSFSEETGSIEVCVMGEVQKEILAHILKSRFNIDAKFGPAHIVYKETIAGPVEGVGHFEPLRHYAEVHLLIEPTEPGSGISFDSNCSTDELALNWQRLILTHLAEKKHLGVLTGSELTDVKITLIAGRAHEKHTEGGDFRQATYRAVRQGLMQADSVLLEPILEYRLEVPGDSVGHALSDMQRMNGTVSAPDIEGSFSVITGTVPVACLGNYAQELSAYTHGEGRLFTTLSGYSPCHNTEEVLEEYNYYPDLDTDNPSASVFCQHGAATIIPWDEVRDHMHIDTGWSKEAPVGSATDLVDNIDMEALKKLQAKRASMEDTRSFSEKQRDYFAAEDELKAIFERTYGKVKPRVEGSKTEFNESSFAGPDESVRDYAVEQEKEKKHSNKGQNSDEDPNKEFLLIDGYNIIYASENLKALAQTDLKAARDSLIDILNNFQGYRREELILVFDAYRVRGGTEHVEKQGNLTVIYTKEAETADQYIEKAAHIISKKYRVKVATSDAIEQIIVFGSGAIRMSARELWKEIELTNEQIREKINK